MFTVLGAVSQAAVIAVTRGRATPRRTGDRVWFNGSPPQLPLSQHP